MQTVAEKMRSAAMERVCSAPLSETFGCMMDGTAIKLTDLSYRNFIMLLYREALDRLRVRSNIILLINTVANMEKQNPVITYECLLCFVIINYLTLDPFFSRYSC